MTQVTSNTQPVMPKSRMALSVVAMVLSLGLLIPMVLSIIAIIKANKVTNAWMNQQHNEAIQASASAKTLGIIALIWAIVAKCLLISLSICLYTLSIGMSIIPLFFY